VWRSRPRISLSDSSHFAIIDSRFLSDRTVDSILIAFHGDTAGQYDSRLIIEYDDTTIVLPLNGFGKSTTRSLAVSASALFTHDTVSPCTAALVQSVILRDSSCLPWYVVGYDWSGDDTSYYSIVQSLQSLLTGTDTLSILFAPDTARHFSATLTVRLSDGRTIPIALAGDGAPYAQLALSTSDVSTDIIGDVVHVPIYFTHTGPLPPVKFSVHYDTTFLHFEDGRAANGTSVWSGKPGAGSFRVDLDSTVSAGGSELVAYLDFQVFPTEDSCTSVVIDSAQFVGNAQRVCAILMVDSAVSRICGPYDCATPILSDFIRYSQLTRVSVAPNPTTSNIRIATDQDLGPVTITLCTTLGEAITTSQQSLSSGKPIDLSVSDLPRGTYYLTVQMPSGDKRSFSVVKQ
jgi:hypothetical protein